MQAMGNWGERIDEDHISDHMLSRWDFEELLAELRAHPVLRGQDSRHPIIAKEYFARA
jgi:hypothetical protein